MAIDEVQRPDAVHAVSTLPAVLHGFPVHVLLGWARERIMCPNAEIREALRSPKVLATLQQLVARERHLERFDRKVIA